MEVVAPVDVANPKPVGEDESVDLEPIPGEQPDSQDVPLDDDIDTSDAVIDASEEETDEEDVDHINITDYVQ